MASLLAATWAQGTSPLSPDQEHALKPKDAFRDCENCPEMVVVPAGKFTMGSPVGEEGRYNNEGPQHEVTIAKPFAIGKFAVTVDQFAAFVKETGYATEARCWIFEDGKAEESEGKSWQDPGFSQGGNHPATCLSWYDAKAFVAWLSRRTHREYRLPSESEWEYAARAGSTSRYFFGDDEKDFCRHGNGGDLTTRAGVAGWLAEWPAVPCDDGYVYTAPVGSFLPNAFGLYDMHGNIASWVEDCYQSNYSGAPPDGSARTTGLCGHRVVRAGAWMSIPSNLRSAFRTLNSPDIRLRNFGFRVARTLGP